MRLKWVDIWVVWTKGSELDIIGKSIDTTHGEVPVGTTTAWVKLTWGIVGIFLAVHVSHTNLDEVTVGEDTWTWASIENARMKIEMKARKDQKGEIIRTLGGFLDWHC